MHIVFLNPYLPPPFGGIEKEILALASEWIRAGEQVTVVTTDSRFPSGSNRLVPPALPEGVEGLRLRGYLRSVLRGFQPSRAPLIVPGLSHALERLKPDLLMLYNVGWPLTLFGVLPRLPRVRSLYRTYYHPPGGRLRRAKEYVLMRGLRLADGAVAASRAEAQQLVATGFLPPERVAVVPPGVSVYPADGEALARFRESYDLVGRRVILHVARLSRFKGTGHLVEVLPEVRERTGQDVVLVLVGESPDRPIIEELIDRHGVRRHVRFTGAIPDDRTLHVAYRAADVFALPSAYESLGFVFIEAMSEGVPVIACPGGGVQEVVGDGGVVLPEFGDTKSLMETLVWWLRHENVRRQYGEAGRKRVLSDYQWRYTAENMLALAKSIPR